MDLYDLGGYWPHYEDGTPVRIGDTVQGTFDPMTVESVGIYANTTNIWSTPDVDGTRDHLHLSPGECVKRVGDAPEGAPCLGMGPDGDIGTCILEEDHQAWHLIIDGVRYGVGNYARRVIAEALDLTTSRKTLPSGIAWPEVDGEPVVPGDVLWDTETGRRTRVDRVGFDQGGVFLVMGDGEEMRAEAFTRLTLTMPDSWERLAEDARKDPYDYWLCRRVECSDCPALVDGKTPCQRYDTGDCESAVAADIVARAKALSGVVGDE